MPYRILNTEGGVIQSGFRTRWFAEAVAPPGCTVDYVARPQRPYRPAREPKPPPEPKPTPEPVRLPELLRQAEDPRCAKRAEHWFWLRFANHKRALEKLTSNG